MLNKFLILSLGIILNSCASLNPAVKTVCSVCSTVCPFVSLTDTVTVKCAEGQLYIINWKDVEKGAKPEVACRVK